uniref:hypothetical protein n=1 Tax=Shewanella baltica TaxID=62322 RepID=UPI004048EAAA
MNNKGQLEYYGLKEWWQSTFSLEERDQIENIIEPGKEGSYLTRGCSFVSNSTKLRVIYSIASYLTNEDTPDLYFKVFNEAEKFSHEATLSDLHLLYGYRVLVLQRNLKKWDGIYDLLKDACYKQIEMSEDVARYFKINDLSDTLPFHAGYTRLAIMLQKEKIHSEVVRICQKALDEGWNGKWETRINANKYKEDNPTKVVITNKPPKVKPVYNGTVPLLEGYFPSYNKMNSQQKSFYKKLEKSLDKDIYIDIEGNISYVYVYLYRLISKVDEYGYAGLYSKFMKIAELCREEKLRTSCQYWAYDCLLGDKKYEEFLEATKPNEANGVSTHFSNKRLNIQEHIGIEANVLDIISLIEVRKSKFITKNQELYRKKVIDVLLDYGLNHGGWFNILRQWSGNDYHHDSYLFAGSPSLKPAGLKIKSYYSIGSNINTYKKLLEDAENRVREEIGVPFVGEGWISESDLYRKLEKAFPETRVLQHGNPSWLGRQHYDIWLPDWKVAVEYHGKQHFEPVDFFGGEEAYKQNVERDRRKIKLSEENNVQLFVVQEGFDVEKLINDINSYKK